MQGLPTTIEITPGQHVPVVPAIVRGCAVTEDLVTFGGRGGALTFATPDPLRLAPSLPLASGALLADLHELSFDDILDFLEELGRRLDIDSNEHMQWARELTYACSGMTRPLIDAAFSAMHTLLSADRIREMADSTIGLDHLNGWVPRTLADGTVEEVRAFGARGLHIIPGNGPGGAASTIIKCAYTRSDCIIKTPSNNPFAAVAIGLTMCEMAPDHPITRHVAIAYWRGGDESVESVLLQPHNVEKIVAWGGFASVRHVTRYIQPGLELISLDPKFSASVVDLSGDPDEATVQEAALRLAVDIGALNQEPCSAARVAYVVVDAVDDTELLERFGALIYEELVGLPAEMSTRPKSIDPDLRSSVYALRLQDDFYTVYGGEADEGCIIVSLLSDPVGFVPLLSGRTANIVPVASLGDAIARFDAYTQTVGVFPERAKEAISAVAPFYGAQRIVSLGYANNHKQCGPHDGIELERRMCKWIVRQQVQPIPLTYAATRGGDYVHSAAITLEGVRGPDAHAPDAAKGAQ